MTRVAFARRRGSISLLTLLAIPILLLLVAMVIYVGMLRDTKTESQNGADAAALAAARELASDDLLTTDVGRAKARIRRAREAAMALGEANVARGELLRFEPNESNDPEGDLIFGQLDHPKGGTFRVASGNPSDWTGDKINAIQVTTRRISMRSPFGTGARNDVRARAVAMIDHRIVGFRPNDDEPVPLMPLAVYTDHQGTTPNTWDHECRKLARDELRYDYEQKRFVPGADLIPEVTVVIGSMGQEQGAVSAALLQVGVDSFEETVAQVVSGMTRDQLRRDFDSGFVFAHDNRLNIPGTPECPKVGSPAREFIEAALRRVMESGEARLWPLFAEVDEDDSRVRVSGWMAARVAAIGQTEGGGIKLTLQPAVLAHRSAVTESRAEEPAFWANNRTVYRVRLAE